MNQITQQILEEVAQLHGIPEGAYNIRENGKSVGRSSTEEIQIETRADQKGIEVRIRPGTKNRSVHIPVVISQSGLEEVVYNDFYIGDDCDVTIIAGCGIHNAGSDASRHDGVHSFFIGKNARVKYVEKHYGSGDGNGERIMNPETIVDMDENSYMEMDTVQIRGVDSTVRKTDAHLKDGARLVVMERLMTHGKQRAESYFNVYCDGQDSGANVVSRSVAREESYQKFCSRLIGNAACSGHTECDAIIMDSAKISAIPELEANHPDAALIHEAAIGKIAGEQIVKLMTLGLTEEEAEEKIVEGFLR
ncbi:MAG TPA: SufD family Fe-S cluster assembly protein [Candidatus Eisenbergiella merdigallinarum]|uniref:SufD family Fe-S cluster assembly protein n=1 Tax=Candidatus Eisenbergiella merdigallinarum TaxID=2838552 RepID=A0A9D2MQT6_9FIRM|nr:SufD family Fe-S cluster assembly protein [Candidatus Eisenbergiella merdigallinarum]